jgi:RimJ/RimL family protein N-acetyltransferase
MSILIKTKRLYLREFQLSDDKSMFNLNADWDVIKYTGDPPFDSIEQAHNFIMNYSEYRRSGFGRWAVIQKEDDEFIGWCGLKRNEQELVDIGFRFFKKYWGQGFATESAKICLKYGFEQLDLKEIIGRAADENLASIHVLKKLGMKFWKKDTCKGIDNSVYYRLTKKEYQIHLET